MQNKKLVKVSAVVGRESTATVCETLKKEGFNDIYMATARIPVLTESEGVLALFGNKRSLDSKPGEIITCFSTPESEENILHLIATAAKLHIPGNGSVYSEDVDLTESHELINEDTMGKVVSSKNQFYSDLVGICCVVQRGQGDAIAKVVLETGSAVPAITFGIGTGIRDKLGLLRITIPAEKEVLNLVCTSWDAEEVLEAMIAAGKLDQPGKGFINTYPVRKGILNTKISSGKHLHAASMEQVINAIDNINGNLEWRKTGDQSRSNNNRTFFGGRDLNVICNEGTGLALVKAAMSAGGAGATIERLKLLGKAESDDKYLSRAREVCKLMVPETKLPDIFEAMKKAGAFEKQAQAMVYNSPVPKAFTYMKKAS